MSDDTYVERILQEELQELRSLTVQADHVRWITVGEDAAAFDALVCQFSQEWREWTERLARRLVAHGWPPDGRISALTDGRYRAWLPADWLEISESSNWLQRELELLAGWARSRSDELDEEDLVHLLVEIEDGLLAEFDQLGTWLFRRNRPLDVVEEAGRESFPASDPPSWWSGPSEISD